MASLPTDRYGIKPLVDEEGTEEVPKAMKKAAQLLPYRRQPQDRGD